MEKPKPIQSLNTPFPQELSIEEFEKRARMEILEERLEMACWINCGTVCICVDN